MTLVLLVQMTGGGGPSGRQGLLLDQAGGRGGGSERAKKFQVKLGFVPF